MFECLILGDSIAVQLHYGKPDCKVRAVSGLNSLQFNFGSPGNFTAKVIVISLGSNDHVGINTEQELLSIRNRAIAERVVWIVPAIKPNIQAIVRRVAARYGDQLAIMKSLQPDGVHFDARGVKFAVDDIWGTK